MGGSIEDLRKPSIYSLKKGLNLQMVPLKEKTQGRESLIPSPCVGKNTMGAKNVKGKGVNECHDSALAKRGGGGKLEKAALKRRT